jgi:hypothetical protein
VLVGLKHTSTRGRASSKTPIGRSSLRTAASGGAFSAVRCNMKRKKHCKLDITIRMPLDVAVKAAKSQARNPKACRDEHQHAAKLMAELQKLMNRYC